MIIEKEPDLTERVKIAFAKVIEAAIYLDAARDAHAIANREFDAAFREAGCLGPNPFVFSFDALKAKWESQGRFELALSNVPYRWNKNGSEYKIGVMDLITHRGRDFYGKNLPVDKLAMGVDVTIHAHVSALGIVLGTDGKYYTAT